MVVVLAPESFLNLLELLTTYNGELRTGPPVFHELVRNSLIFLELVTTFTLVLTAYIETCNLKSILQCTEADVGII